MSKAHLNSSKSGTIERLCQAVYPSFAMLAGMKLDLFTPLAESAMSADELAAALGVDPARLGPLLYALVNAGLLQVEGARFSNSDEADRLLVRGRKHFMGERHRLWEDLWSACLKSAESIRAGAPQASHDFSTMPSVQLESFLRGLHPLAVAEGRSFAEGCDLSECRTLVDVAGGSGGFSMGIAEVQPQVRVTVADLPEVTPITRRFVEEAGVAQRIDVVDADVVAAPLVGMFDVAVLRNFLQVLSAGQAQAVLVNVSGAIVPGGWIYISGHLLDDGRVSPAETVAFNLVFLNLYEAGQAYTEGEHRTWLTQTGFEEIERVDEDTIRARRPR